jgi:hypothetical protein
LISLFALSWLHQSYYDFDHDDAYISYRYAVHWAQGHGPVYNVGERVEGYSNFLHVAALAVAYRLGLDVVRTSRALGTFACFGLVAVTYVLVSRVLQRSRTAALVAAAAVALHASIAVWARSGLETVPFAFFVLSAQTLFLLERRRGASHWRSGLVFGIAALVRADGVLFVAVTGLFLAFTRGGVRRCLSLTIASLAVFGPYLAWRFAYYGYPFPNSYYLKMGGGLFQQVRGAFYLYNFAVPFGGLLLCGLPLLLLALRDRDRDDARLYLGVCVAAFCIYVAWVGGDHMPMSRFLVPIVAAMQALLVETTLELLGRLRGLDGRALRAARVAFLVCIVTAGALPSLNRRRLPASFAVSNAVLTQQWAMAGRWLGEHVPPTCLMATEPAGAVAYHSHLRIIDMLGVNDLHIAHLEVAGMGRGSAGHEKRDFAYVLSRRPDIVFRGVRTSAAGRDSVLTFADGSMFRRRCEPLGRGPVADDFGTVTMAPLFIRFEERVTDQDATASSR